MPATPHPWRRIPGSAKAPSRRSLSSVTRALGKSRAQELFGPLRAGIDHAPSPALAARLDAALQLLDGLDADALQEASDQLLGDAERLLERAAPASLTAAVASHLGLERALGMRVAAESVSLDAGHGGWMTAVWLTDAPERRRPASAFGWGVLRHAVVAADEQDYAAAVAWVRDHPSDDPLVQRRLAVAFPDEPWANALLAEELRKPTPDHHTLEQLLTACSDRTPLDALVAVDAHARLVADAAADLAHVLPAASVVPALARAIEALLVKPKYGPLFKTPPRQCAEALAQVGDAASAEVMVGYLGHRVLGAQAVSFFEAHPEHASIVEAKDPDLHRRLTASGPVNTCPPKQVPELLAQRSWRPARHREVVLKELRWPKPVDATYAGPEADESDVKTRPMTAEELATWSEQRFRSCDRSPVYTRGAPTTYVEVPEPEGLALWNAGGGYVSDELRWATRHGVAALPGFLAGNWARWLHEEHGRQRLTVLEGMLTPDVVPAFVDLFHRKRWRRTALRWLCDHPELAAIGLVPAALGPKGATRKRAQATLLGLARAGGGDAVRSVAADYGEEAAAAVAELLARPPSLDGKPPKLPDWLAVGTLPPLQVDGGALPTDAVAAFVELLSLDPSGQGYDVDLPIEPASLETFLLHLLEQWVDHDAEGRHDWIQRAVLVFEVDGPRRRVAELARAWAQNAKAKVLRALPVLAELGDERSLLALTHIAHSSRIKAVKETAQAQLVQIAEDRGWSREELDDRTVPTLGLDARGGLELGHRGVRAEVTSELTVQLRDAHGAPLRALPRAGDAPEAHRVAKQRLAGLRKDVQSIATRQCQRLEAAMVAGRTWPLAEARRWLFDAPLLAGVVRALVWTCDGLPFRICEDGTFADVDDEEITLVDGTVAVAHPLHLDVGTWADLFADYDCIQPFPQLGRPTCRRDDVTLESVGPVEGRKAMGRLESRGWSRQGDNWISGWRRGEATVRAEPGIEVAYLSSAQPVQLTPGPTEGLDDVAFSELVHDLRSFQVG